MEIPPRREHSVPLPAQPLRSPPSHRRGALAALALIVVGLLALPLGAAAQEGEAGRTVDLIEVSGIIDPTMAGYLQGKLDSAAGEGIHAAIVQLDTPGGLEVSMRDMTRQILNSEIPVVVWIAPQGARAASAGTFITYASHIAYMAPATELGAATPINLGGDQPEALERKVINDAVAFIREMAEARDRNADWAEDAVREGASVGATEAVEINVVEGMAATPSELLEGIHGTAVEVAGARTVTLDTWDAAANRPSVQIRIQEMNLFQRLLHTITNPEIAFLLITLGTLGLIFEIYNPGIGLAGILGAVGLILGFYALSVLPTNWAGVLLIVLGIVFFIVDLQVAGLGIWTAGGVAALAAGGLLLFAGASPELQVDPWVVVAVAGGTLVFFAAVMTAALRVRLRRPTTGEESIVGMSGVARTDIAPEGTVMAKGTLWRARTMETGIAAGDPVRIKATEGLLLLVEPDHGEDADEAAAPAARPSSQ